MYTMNRTQIYLSERDLAILDREETRTGRSRSRLIRDAIEQAYGPQASAEEFERVLRENAGFMADAPFTGQEFVEAIRTRGFGALEDLWPEWYGADADRHR